MTRTYTASNHPQSIRENFFPRTVICGTDSRDGDSIIANILASPSFELTITDIQQPHSLTIYFGCLFGFVLGER